MSSVLLQRLEAVDEVMRSGRRAVTVGTRRKVQKEVKLGEDVEGG